MKEKIGNALGQIAGGIFALVIFGILGLGLADFAGCKPLPDHTPPPISKAEERYEAALDRYYHAKQGADLYAEQIGRAIERGDIEEAKKLQSKMSDMLLEITLAVLVDNSRKPVCILGA